MNKLSELRELLEGLAPGPVPKDIRPRLEQLLVECWEDFEGSDLKGMAGYKLLGRMEAPKWEPPTLTFIIERHRGTVRGSTRAELQHWTVDLDKEIAAYERSGYRQIYPRAAPWKAKPVAEEIAQLIHEGKKDPRLKWLSKDRVMLRTREIIPDYDYGFKQTIEGRRKRLYRAMEEILVPLGWKRNRNIWERER